jgi:hypothetical protein
VYSTISDDNEGRGSWGRVSKKIFSNFFPPGFAIEFFSPLSLSLLSLKGRDVIFFLSLWRPNFIFDLFGTIRVLTCSFYTSS